MVIEMEYRKESGELAAISRTTSIYRAQ